VSEAVECWPVCVFYTPFMMGGDVNQRVRFKVQGFEREIKCGKRTYTMFCYEREAEWRVHEKTTGGYMTSFALGTPVSEAVKQIKHLISITPDYDRQIVTMLPFESAKVVATGQALKRLANR